MPMNVIGVKDTEGQCDKDMTNLILPFFRSIKVSGVWDQTETKF
jgi:hypothetical protein